MLSITETQCVLDGVQQQRALVRGWGNAITWRGDFEVTELV